MSDKGTNPDEAAWRLALGFEPKYSKRIVDYCAALDMSERGIKKWIRISREKWIARGCPDGGPQFPPLDDPAKIPEWALGHLKNSPRTAVLAAGARGAAAPATSPASVPGANAAPPAPPPEPRAPIDISTVAPVDFASAVERQGRYYALAAANYDEALGRGAPASELTMLAKERDSALDKLRSCQSELAKIEEARGDRPHLDDIRAELAPIVAGLVASHVDFLVERLGGTREYARQLSDEWMRDLQANRFTLTPPPPSAPPIAA